MEESGYQQLRWRVKIKPPFLRRGRNGRFEARGLRGKKNHRPKYLFQNSMEVK